MLTTDFQNSFSGRHAGKFTTNSHLNIPPHLHRLQHYLVKYECQKTGSNLKHVHLCIVINDKFQDSTAKHLSCDGLLQYKFIIQFISKRILKIDEHLGKL